MTADERLERLLNRAGQTISDLPDHYDEYAHNLAAREATQWSGMISWRQYTDYILHLSDVIDRMEWTLDNLLNLYERNVHIVANTDPPEGVTREQFNAVVHAIYESWEKARAGLEPWDAWYEEEE